MRASNYEVTRIVALDKAEAVVVIVRDTDVVPHEVRRLAIPQYVHRLPAA